MLIANWKSQIRKGYLELCILKLIQNRKSLYGFELLDILKSLELEVKEGTIYPLLNRMTSDGVLIAVWETEKHSHPRKFYSLTPKGAALLVEMQQEFGKLKTIYDTINNKKERT